MDSEERLKNLRKEVEEVETEIRKEGEEKMKSEEMQRIKKIFSSVRPDSYDHGVYLTEEQKEAQKFCKENNLPVPFVTTEYYMGEYRGKVYHRHTAFVHFSYKGVGITTIRAEHTERDY